MDVPLSRRVTAATVCLLLAMAPLGGCEGPQSALHPAGVGAEQIANLFWWMAGIAALIWMVVIAVALYSSQPDRSSYHPRETAWLIIGGGAAVPTLLLGGLLVFGLTLLPESRSDTQVDLRISVSGEQWWWRVRYPGVDGETVELANEIRLPVNQRAEFTLSSPDVIHSFWIPSLGGKMDMIPGRTTRLVLEPTRTGVYRGACAEYCGASHAYMNMDVVVMEPEAFADWLRKQAAPARPPAGEKARAGRRYFLANGCGACHRIRGTGADGRIAPDLTHVGSRLSIGASLLPASPESFARWISHTELIKPDVKMPSFAMLPDSQIAAMAAYLSELK